MTRHLLLTIRFHDPRYHGAGEWPPSPARLFQALVAGIARGNTVPDVAREALSWLESLPPPVIAAPKAAIGSRMELFVPNNDLDAVGGDPARVGEIRTQKVVIPYLLEEAALMYAWAFPVVAEKEAIAVMGLADGLYQLGRGVDMAWAVGETVDDEGIATRLAAHRGTVHRPVTSGEGNRLLCPAPGSLDSLATRHRANAQKIRTDRSGSDARVLFAQVPKPRFVEIGYATDTPRTTFDLRDREDLGKLWAWPLGRASTLIERVRDRVAARLVEAFPDRAGAIEQTMIGRLPENRVERIRILPLPSIGHEHVDPGVRRIAVEVPNGCVIDARDVHWAFAGLETCDPLTGVVDGFVLTRSDEREMLARYEAQLGCRRWRSITAVALPTTAQRRRIEPTRMRAEAKGARERQAEELIAREAVRTALRHAGVPARAVHVEVQREPFEPRGTRAERFSDGTRFAKERLWHVDVELSEPIRGPLVIGDGRFLGLGVMRPVDDASGLFGFEIETDRTSRLDAVALVRAMRRALMSRLQREVGARPLGRYLSGHEEDGSPATGPHLAVHHDPTQQRLLVIAPHALDRTEIGWGERAELKIVERALEGFNDLRAGNVGRFRLNRLPASSLESYRAHAASWVSVVPYTVCRHRRSASASEALIEDVVAECQLRGLPRPAVTVKEVRGIEGRGLQGMLELVFHGAITGPLVLGRTRYLGGGLFVPRRN